MSESPCDPWHRRGIKKKRATHPKTKGCYQCSQRRISCDRSQPSCGKCITKGLECSGLGIRYRFESGIASRGKHVGKTVHDVFQSNESLPTIIQDDTQDDFQDACLILSDDPISPSVTSESSDPEQHPQEPICDAIYPISYSQDVEVSNMWTTSSYSSISGRFDVIDCWQVFSLGYLTSNVAPQLVAIDDSANGWRRFVLPISLQDDVVMNAALAVSAYHMAEKSSGTLRLAEESYTKAIKGLFRRKDLITCDPLSNCYNVLTILLLLITSMITGCSDFPTLFRMLKSAVEVVGDEDGLGSRDLVLFLRREIRKYIVYAEPLINERAGIDAVQLRASQSFGCLQYCSELHPEHSIALLNIKDQIQQSYNIYLRRALGDLDTESSVRLVERFVRTAKLNLSTSPGEQVLIWATFIAAAEASIPQHQAFFVDKFRAFYKKNGFGNNLKAMTLLNAMWRSPSRIKWTTVLPQAQTFIV